MRQPACLVIATCAAGLSGLLLAAAPLPPARAAADGAVPEALLNLDGTRAAGSKKSSPFAAAKESEAAVRTDLRVDRSRLWWMLLPFGLAAISYGVLRGQEE